MVEFCHHCGASLPKGDVTIKNGKTFTSPDYVCPDCKRTANPGAALPEPGDGADIVIREGEVKET